MSHDQHTDDLTAPTPAMTEISRRRFLGNATAALGAAAIPSNVALRSLAAQVPATPTTATVAPGANPTPTPTPTPSPTPTAAAPGSGILVLVTLYGGNDGIGTVVPFTDSAYYAGRGALAIQPAEVLPLDGQFGLNPALKGVKALWDAKRVAIVRGVGYPNPSRSHFRSMDIWQTAVPETSTPYGWLGRWFDATGPDPIRMVAMGTSVPRAMVATKGAGAALPTGRVQLPGNQNLAGAYADLARGAGTPTLGPWGSRLAGSAADLLRVQATFGPIVNAGAQAAAVGASASLEGGAVANGDAVKSQLQVELEEVAMLIKAGVPTRVFSVSLGGFDTHANEKDAHARLLGALDTALSSFARQLEGDPRGAAVTVVVYSEFGRRVAANLSDGTDHGTAAPVIVLGPAVKGGFYGDPPSLTDLDQGDLKFTTDFRSVYATVLGQTLGIDPGAVLGKSFAALPFL